MTDHSPDVPPAQADVPSTLAHRLTPMRGRDPSGAHRVATPLELLFGPTFVVAFSVAGQQASHLFAEGHISSALLGFRFAMFAIMWAWINYSWFASAFDCDDWVYRLTTMVQMVGVVVGYIVMRVMLAGALVLIEMFGPVIAERRQGGTPWHAHHIAERYSLVAITTLGEGVAGCRWRPRPPSRPYSLCPRWPCPCSRCYSAPRLA